MTLTVKCRHIGMTKHETVGTYETREAANAKAVEINNKPFTPYYAWIEGYDDAKLAASNAARNSFIGGH